MTQDFHIRPVQGDDIPFIYSTWLRSFRNDSFVGLSVKKNVFFDNYQLILDRILSKSNTKTLVACKIDEPNVIYGYLVAEPNESVLHYAFVKESFWGLGIAKALFHAAFGAEGAVSTSAVSITHRTKSAQRLTDRFYYNPFTLYSRGGE